MSLRTTVAVLAILLTSVVVVRAQDAAAEEDFVKVREIPKAERELNKGVEGVVLEKNSNKFSRTTRVPLEVDQVLILTVWSFDFQPRVVVYPKGGKDSIAAGMYGEPKEHEGKTARMCYLQFHPPDRGVYDVKVTTKEINQGKYFIEGAIWGPAPEKKEEEETAADAPAASTESLKKLDFEQSKRSKNWKKDTNHVYGGTFTQGTKTVNGKVYPNVISYLDVFWLEPGDTIDTYVNPGEKGSFYRNVDREEAGVYYLTPDKRKDAKGTEVVTRYRVVVFDPEKEIYALIAAEPNGKDFLPALVERAKQLIAERKDKARPKP